MQNAEWGLLLLLQIASWYQLHTLLPSWSTLHICPKFQWTFEQLKAAYLEVQYFHRRSSKFPVKHFSLLLEWFTPFFNRHYSFYIWDSNFYLSVNIVVLYKFMVRCIQNFRTKVKCEVSLDGKRFKIAIMFSGHWWRSRVERDGFVIVDVKYVICGIFLPSNSSVTKVYAQSTFFPPVCSPHSAFCTQPAFYPQSAVCVLHWPNISDNPVMVASSVTPTIYGLTQYTRIFYWVLLPGVRKTDYSGYFKSCFHQLWLSKAVARRKNCRNPNVLNLCSEMAEA